ncbi:MAG: GGDEF domain-containing protein [Thiogranum sp.]
MHKKRIVAEASVPSPGTLPSIDLFRGEDPEILDWVVRSCGVRCLAPGEILIDPDHDNDVVYIILTGRAEARVSHEDCSWRVFLEPGECAGEISVIEDSRPSATVAAHSDCQVLAIEAALFRTLINRSSVITWNLLRILSARVRKNDLMVVQTHAQKRIHERNALIDSMTGLYNRRWMETTLDRIVERCAQSQQALALLMIDTDHFKCYNDAYGHLAGDQLLISIARAITESIRAADYACRYGGDEFVVVLPRADAANALQVAESVCHAVTKHVSHAGNGPLDTPVTVSVGVSSLEAGMNTRQLLASADAALYRAKAAGRGGVSQ